MRTSHQLDPLRDLVVLQDRMNRLFEDANQRRTRGAEAAHAEMQNADWMPPADINEVDHEYVVALDLPGIDRSLLELNVDGDQLSVRGDRSLADARETQLRGERPRGKFSRTFAVPASVDQERIEAEYKDGVLYIHLPKRAEQRAQRVEIKVS